METSKLGHRVSLSLENKIHCNGRFKKVFLQQRQRKKWALEDECKKKSTKRDCPKKEEEEGKKLNKRKRKFNGGTERKLTKADEGRSLDFAGNLNVHQQNRVLSVEREREPVLFNQIAFQSRPKPVNQNRHCLKLLEFHASWATVCQSPLIPFNRLCSCI